MARLGRLGASHDVCMLSVLPAVMTAARGSDARIGPALRVVYLQPDLILFLYVSWTVRTHVGVCL